MSPLTEPTKLIFKKDPVLADPYFNNVSLLLHGDGANGSTTIVDSSSNNFSITANNGARISTAQAKYGPSSIEFLSSANTGLSVPSNSVFQFGTGDWTVEAWIYQRTLAFYATLLEIGNHGNSNGFVIVTGSYRSGLALYNGAFFNAPSSGTIITNQWQFVTISRAGNFLYFSVNGTVDSPVLFNGNLTSAATVSVAYPYGNLPLANNNGYRFDGYIDDLRITKGIARYTSNFTPPTAPFPEVIG